MEKPDKTRRRLPTSLDVSFAVLKELSAILFLPQSPLGILRAAEASGNLRRDRGLEEEDSFLGLIFVFLLFSFLLRRHCCFPFLNEIPERPGNLGPDLLVIKKGVL